MSHFTVMVIGDNPEEQLAPYSESIETAPRVREEVSDEEIQSMIEYYKNPENGGHEYTTFDEIVEKKGNDWNGNRWEKRDGVWVEVTTYNPKSKWDWYQLGGRWTGFLKLKQGANGEVGEPGILTTEAEEGYVDAALKKDIDFEGMKNDAGEKASKRYDEVMSYIGHTEPNKPWTEFIERVKKEEITIDDAREQYHTQPRLVAVKENQKELGFILDADRFLVSKEEYVEQARNNAISTFAVVKDGKWYEKGEMGWFAMVSNEMDQNEWNKKVDELIASLEDDTLISIYDCHI